MERTRQTELDRLLLRIVDGGLAGTLFLVPLLLGGYHAIGQLALTALAWGAASAWAVRQSLQTNASWRPTQAGPLVLTGLAIVALQATALPPGWLERLAPRMPGVLPALCGGAADPAALGNWTTLSFAPAETLSGLVLLADYVLLFFTASQRMRCVEDIERLLRWFAWAAIGMAAFGLVQLVAGNGLFFWFYEYPYSQTFGAAKGSFVNRNHFASFLALGIGPLIWRLQDGMRRNDSHAKHSHRHAPRARRGDDFQTPLLGLALGIVLFAGLLSLSRGGMIAMFLAAAVVTAVSYGASALSGRFAAVLAGAGLLIGLSLAIFGHDRVGHRLDDIASGSVDRLDRSGGRRTVWTTTIKAATDSGPLGTGAGSFREVYPMYADAPSDGKTEPRHAENGYLQIWLETGAVGFVLALAGVALCGLWCVRALGPSVPARLRLCGGAAAGGLAASAAHALVDFAWYIPACMAATVLLAACALRVGQLARHEKQARHAPLCDSCGSILLPRPVWAFGAAGLVLGGVWMTAACFGPALAQPEWDRYLVARLAAEAQGRLDPDETETDVEEQERWIAAVEKVVRLHPTHLWAHLKLAETHRIVFDKLQAAAENPMSLAQIGDAVRQSKFPSRKAMVEWLSRGIGPHWTHLERCLEHTRKALTLCPLEGRAWVYLADLSFLFGADADAKRRYIEQAVRVRPYDGSVLYAAGCEALLAGDPAQWIEYARRAFHRGRGHQQQIIADLINSTPPENVPETAAFILREFQPELDGVRFLYQTCAKHCSAESLAALRLHWIEKTESEAETSPPDRAARLWFEAYRWHAQAENGADALRCIRNAQRCKPDDFNIQYALGSCLLDQQIFEEAERHLRWCLQRKPGNAAVEAKLRLALKGRIGGPRRAAAESERPIHR